MSDYTQMKIDDMEAVWSGGFKRARGSLGVSAFGLNVSDLPPGYDRIPPHNHSFDGQEEVYFALAGSGWIVVAGERIAIDADTFIRVGPECHRSQVAGLQGLRLLIVGGTPGQPYKASGYHDAGAPEPVIKDLPGVIAAREAGEAGETGDNDVTVKKISEMEAMSGFEGVSLTPLRRELGVTAFGLNLLRIDPVENPQYPNHDHTDSGQEEVYVPIAGSATIKLDGQEERAVTVGEMIRVAPETTREWLPGPDGVTLLAIGCAPGKQYEPPARPS
ncbi:MAG: hypothetical protein WAP35_03440 [Solirubrobacterales bacterium]